SMAASPATVRILRRVVWPETSATAEAATPRLLARSRVSAALAAPSSGTARTRALMTARPSASCSTPSIASRPPRGVRRTVSVSPSPVRVKAPLMPASRRPSSDDGRVDVEHDHPLEEEDDEQQDDGRDVDAAEIGQDGTDGPERGLGDLVEEVPDRPHHVVARVDDVEGDQPADDGRGDQEPCVEVEHDHENIENRAHCESGGW